MSTEIHNQLNGPVLTNVFTKATEHQIQNSHAAVYPSQQKAKTVTPPEQLKALHEDIQKIVEELKKISDPINWHMEYEMSSEAGQVVVRIINNDTGEVIKMLPPEELQNLHKRIRETVGVLVDEKI